MSDKAVCLTLIALGILLLLYEGVVIWFDC
jgi:hypothetical protein